MTLRDLSVGILQDLFIVNHVRVIMKTMELLLSSSATVGQSRRFSDTFIQFYPTVWPNDCGKGSCTKRDETQCNISKL